MNVNFDKDSFACRFDYCIGPVRALEDPSLHARAQEYRRRLSGMMRPLSGEDAFKIPKARGYYAMRKYDGEFAMLAFDGKKLISVNPGGTVRVGLPAYKETEKLLQKAKV